MTGTARVDASSSEAWTPGSPGRESLSPFAGRYRTLSIGMIALIGLSAFESLAVATAMPWVAAALDGMALYATAFAGPLASGVIGMTAAGSWTDRRGPTSPLLVGVGLFVVGLLVAGFAPTMLVLVVGRIVQGIGSGMLIVALYVVVARVYPELVRPRVFAAFAAAWVVPGIIGPGVAGLVVEHLGWRWVFLGVPVLAVPALLVLRPALGAMPIGAVEAVTDPPRSAHPARAAQRRTALSVVAAAGVLALHHGGQQHGVAMALWVTGGLVALAASIPRLVPAGTLRSRRGLPTAIGLRGLLSAAYFGTEVFVPLLLTTHRSLSAAAAGTFLTATAVAWAAGSALRGRVVGWSDATLLRVGTLGVLAGIGTAGLMLAPTFPLAAAFAGWCLAGFGMGVTIPTLSLLTLRLSPVGEQGVNSSALQVVDAVTSASILALSGALFVVLGGPARPVAFLTCFAVAAATGLLALGLSGRTTEQTHREDKRLGTP
ncbi:putative multidrug-efflux transporter [mine drainage metagenome]|uniref:Putative multidrug-efflux transporter n=1 Tax=mine drainage metagenome TaxID=410659 RepID=A0A1J5PUZ1_9ZZZZ